MARPRRQRDDVCVIDERENRIVLAFGSLTAGGKCDVHICVASNNLA